MKNKKFSPKVKEKAIKELWSCKRGVNEICRELGICRDTLYRWELRYKLHGLQGLKDRLKQTYYPANLKLLAVQEYFKGELKLGEICVKYKINSHSVLQSWVKRYNSHQSFITRNTAGGEYMVKGRNTTIQERIEIVTFCVANNDNRQLTCSKYKVSYNQIRAWMHKFKQFGMDGLIDRRGRKKQPEMLTETEKLNAQIKLLEAENERLNMELELLKKLKEAERRC